MSDDDLSEKELLRTLWAASGCASNPDDFKPTVRRLMWDQLIKWAGEREQDDRRLYRENQQLEAEVQRLRALVRAPQRLDPGLDTPEEPTDG